MRRLDYAVFALLILTMLGSLFGVFDDTNYERPAPPLVPAPGPVIPVKFQEPISPSPAHGRVIR